MSLERRCLVCLAFTVIMGLLLVYTYMDGREPDFQGIIRLHVIANSDSAADQALKLRVRDAVLSYMSMQDDLADVDAVRGFLRGHLREIEGVAAGVIRSSGSDYGVSAGLGVRYIPRREYGDVIYPAGAYEALDITIGSGQGKNWWCVLFPPLCLLDEGTEAAGPDAICAGSAGASGLPDSDAIVAAPGLLQSDAGQAGAGQAGAGQAGSSQASSGQPGAGQAGSSQASSGQASSGQAGSGQPDSLPPDAGQQLILRWQLPQLLRDYKPPTTQE